MSLEVPIIESLKISMPMAYFWVKHVHDVNLEKHCSSCLKGDRNGDFNKDKSSYKNINLTDIKGTPKAYYICIGHTSYVIDRNYHLAFVYKKGSVIEESRLGVQIKIKDAKKINFSKLDIDYTNKLAALLEYNTCRNFQFANWFNDHLAESKLI